MIATVILESTLGITSKPDSKYNIPIITSAMLNISIFLNLTVLLIPNAINIIGHITSQSKLILNPGIKNLSKK